MIWYVYGTVLLSTVNILVLSFPIVIHKEVLVCDSIDVHVTQEFDKGMDEARFVSFSVNGKGTEKFLELV